MENRDDARVRDSRVRMLGRGARMSGADVANIVIAVVSILVMTVLVLRMGHYIRTGRWFR